MQKGRSVHTISAFLVLCPADTLKCKSAAEINNRILADTLWTPPLPNLFISYFFLLLLLLPQWFSIFMDSEIILLHLQ